MMTFLHSETLNKSYSRNLPPNAVAGEPKKLLGILDSRWSLYPGISGCRYSETRRNQRLHRKLIGGLLFILMSLMLSVCANAEENADKKLDKTGSIERIVAIVNEDIITQVELESEMKLIKQQIRAQRSNLPPDSLLEKQVLDRLIAMKIQLQMADSRRIRVDDESLNRAIETMARKNQLSLDQFRQVLERQEINFSEYREKIRNEMIMTRLQQRQVIRSINVTEQEIEDFLANQDLRDSSQDEIRLQHILVVIPEAANPDMIRKAREKAETVVDKLKAGEDFADVAIAYSEGQQALEGGDLGWRKLAEIPTLFSGLVKNMKTGDVSDIVRSPSGFHIIKLAEKRSDEKQYIIEQTKARHILISKEGAITKEEIITRLKNIKQRVEGGESFAELATANSEDKGTAANGGDLGWINPGTMVNEFEEEMNKLAINEISEPFESRYGWHIMQVTDRRNHDSTEEFQKKNALDILRQRKMGPALENWLRQMRDEAFVQIRL